MTRTERAAHPHAIIKDRSVSKNGMDASLPKGGAGNHNWGDLSREQYLEEAADYDEQAELADEGREAVPHPTAGRRTSQLTEEELQQALALRKKAAHSKDVDLGSIARSSAAVSHSPPNRTVPIVTDATTTALTV